MNHLGRIVNLFVAVDACKSIWQLCRTGATFVGLLYNSTYKQVSIETFGWRTASVQLRIAST
jgi:hypothetical protein